ncbi:FxsA family protein [Halopseudomonas pelagia]|uniref:FxsA family protein n=1 Tax=Halopseudomonas pelagia TaxID=553151 RepID=UPI0003A0EFCB|nr:FxsA family protein [Halopseudomonas pelagia]
MPFIRLLLLAIPFIELAGLIMLGQAIGVGLTLLWVLGTIMLGIVVIKSQGWAMVQRLQMQMAQTGSPLIVLKSGMWGVLAGVLLVIPGVFTDAAALICLILAWRHRGEPLPGEPGGPNSWERGGHNIIEGEWKPAEEGEAERGKDIDRQ